MNQYFENTWFRNAFLLGALAAGAFLTQFVPSYEDVAELRDQSARPSAPQVRQASLEGVTGIDVDQRRLRFIKRMA